MAAKKKSRSHLTLAEKAAIKGSQAAFVEKIETAHLNEHQMAILDVARTQQGCYVVLAGPGTGKTFTSIKASTFFRGKAIYFAYNNKIKEDSNFKLVAIDSTMVASTVHSFGLSCLQAFTRGQCKVDKKREKYHLLTTNYLKDNWQWFLSRNQEEIEEQELDVEVLYLDALSWTKTLIHYAQVSLAPLTHQGLKQLLDAFDLTDIKLTSLLLPFVFDAVLAVIELGKQQFLGPDHLTHFDDMIYYPSVLVGVPVRQYDHIIVDEAQDTSRAGLELILKACHKATQIIFVGDPLQSIYAFAGANFDSIDQIIGRLHAQTLPLRFCYRCGRSIVKLANQLGGQLIAAGTHEGTVSVVPLGEYIDHLQPGDVVLSRTLRRLVEGCLKTLQRGKRAKVLGKDIGENISAVITHLEARRLARGVPALTTDLSNLLQVLDEYHREEAQSLEESRKNPEMALEELADKVATVQVFFEAYINRCHNESLRTDEDRETCGFSKTVDDFKKYVHGLFVDEDPQGLILFMTAHRSKGGEWENVFVIGPGEFPHPKAKSAKQKDQERNLMFVTVTRAIENLIFVGQPFACLDVSGYEQDTGCFADQSFPAANHSAEVHRDQRFAEVYQDEEMQPVNFTGADGYGFSTELEGEVVEEEDSQDDDDVVSSVLGGGHDGDDAWMQEERTADGMTFLSNREEDTPQDEDGQRVATAGRTLALEILCPACGGSCADRATGSTYITEDLQGHVVVCSTCYQECVVPLNAFSAPSIRVTAREKPAASGPNNKAEKRGRTQRDRKSNAGRKAKSGVVRQPRQLSLDVRTIQTLDTLNVNNSELYEQLLHQYEPFLTTWAELGYAQEKEEE